MDTLQSLPYGTIIEYRKKKYVKCEGLDGDILMAIKGHGSWRGIKGTCCPGVVGTFFTTDWKSFKVIYKKEPAEVKESIKLLNKQAQAENNWLRKLTTNR